MKRHIITVAVGVQHREYAQRVQHSLRKHGSAEWLTIYTDEPLGFSGMRSDARTAEVNTGFETRSIKTRLPFFSDAERILWLDADTEIMAPIDELWEMPLDGYAMAAGLDGTGNINTGVMVIPNAAEAWSLFSLWHSNWSRSRRFDQPPLYEAIKLIGAKVRTLAPEWNCLGSQVHPGVQPKIRHYADQTKIVFSERKQAA